MKLSDRRYPAQRATRWTTYSHFSTRRARPEITEIKTALWGSYPVELFPIPATEVSETPASGWVAISVNRLYGRDGKFRDLLELRPYYVQNNCVYVFHISGTESYRSDETRE